MRFGKELLAAASLAVVGFPISKAQMRASLKVLSKGDLISGRESEVRLLWQEKGKGQKLFILRLQYSFVKKQNAKLSVEIKERHYHFERVNPLVYNIRPHAPFHSVSRISTSHPILSEKEEEEDEQEEDASKRIERGKLQRIDSEPDDIAAKRT
ncbi:hypothetical protein AVEN_26245-1 [Araneus ventricosus]|uniref:Uncharacterized protein n=1 Tax=Araneus ventricosus TaxID=182803 RepID=A0A4Y2ANK5_ARAVE|nr:hypothetical protein AVEN_26245-1 [Araneus ventricosus]